MEKNKSWGESLRLTLRGWRMWWRNSYCNCPDIFSSSAVKITSPEHSSIFRGRFKHLPWKIRASSAEHSSIFRGRFKYLRRKIQVSSVEDSSIFCGTFKYLPRNLQICCVRPVHMPGRERRYAASRRSIWRLELWERGHLGARFFAILFYFA